MKIANGDEWVAESLVEPIRYRLDI